MADDCVVELKVFMSGESKAQVKRELVDALEAMGFTSLLRDNGASADTWEIGDVEF